MVNSDSKEEPSVIAMFTNNDRVLKMSLYKFIDLYKNAPFYVCHVTEDEYKLMSSQLQNGKFLKERYQNNRDCGYDNSRYLLLNDTVNNIIRLSDCNSNEQQGSYYLDGYNNLQLCYDEKMTQLDKKYISSHRIFGVKVYTTEDHSDIINEYKSKSITMNDLDKVKVKILK